MFKKCRIKNFQSHKDTVLNFDEHVNAIVGTSDSGKTAILRALKWLIHNKPAGSAYVSHWVDKAPTKVSLLMPEGRISKIRKGNQQIYSVNGTELKAFGQNVPDEVTDLLNMGECNFQQQFDSPFLLTKSSGEVSSFFNKIVNLEIIDSAIQKLRSQIREAKNESSSIEEQLQENTEQLNQFEFLPKYEASIIALDKLTNKYIDLVNARNALSSDVDEYKRLKEKVKRQAYITDATKKIKEVEKGFKKYKTLRMEYISLEDALTMLSRLEKRNQSNIKKLYAIGGRYERIKMLNAKYIKLRHECLSLRQELVNIESVLEKHKKYKEEYDKAVAEFKGTFPKKCPLCGRRMKKGVMVDDTDKD